MAAQINTAGWGQVMLLFAGRAGFVLHPVFFKFDGIQPLAFLQQGQCEVDLFLRRIGFAALLTVTSGSFRRRQLASWSARSTGRHSRRRRRQYTVAGCRAAYHESWATDPAVSPDSPPSPSRF